MAPREQPGPFLEEPEMFKKYGRTMQITAPHFCAGMFLTPDRGEVVSFAAPIIRYMTGWTVKQVRTYCEIKKWSLHEEKGGLSAKLLEAEFLEKEL